MFMQKNEQMAELHPGPRTDDPVTIAKVHLYKTIIGLESHLIKESESKVALTEDSPEVRIWGW